MEVHEPKPALKRRVFRWVRRVLLGLGAVILSAMAALVHRAYSLQQADARYEAAVAEADRLDPGWQFEEILSKREVIPDAQNSALHVLAAAKLLPEPEDWDPKRAVEKPAGAVEEMDEIKKLAALLRSKEPRPTTPTLVEEIRKLSPAEQLDRELTRVLRAELDKVKEALPEARSVANLPMGRYEVEWRDDFVSTLLPHIRRSRCVVRLLALDAILAAQEGDSEWALVSSRAILNVGRSIGDEPTLVSILVRITHARLAVDTIERVLGQGEPAQHQLAALQQLLDDEAAQPLLLIGLRGERAQVTAVLGRFAIGELFEEEDRRRRTGWPARWIAQFGNWFLFRPQARVNQAVYLEQMTRAVEAAKTDPTRQRAELRQFEADVEAQGSKAAYPMARLFLPAAFKVAVAHQRMQARLQCARVALAAERYRLDHKTWPASLDQLAPNYLAAIPSDPFGNGTLLKRRVEDGLIVYSIGQNQVDDGGLVSSKSSQVPLDEGFRLWDSEKRRQPPSRTPPPLDGDICP